MACQPTTAMILAAGRGERLRPLSDHLPKPLVDVGGLPLIGHTLLKLAGLGVRRVVINTWHLAEQLQAALGDGADYGVTVLWSREETLMDTGGGLRQALPLLGEEPVLAVNGDILWDLELTPLLEAWREGESEVLLGLVATPPYKRGDFALAAEGALTRSPAGLTYAGIQLLQPAALAPWPVAPFSLNSYYDDAQTRGRLRGVALAGRWSDLGTLERLAEARRQWRPPAPPA